MIYVDTSALFALADPRDREHAVALAAAARSAQRGDTWVTGWHTLYEFTDGVCDRMGQKAAAERLHRLVGNPRLRVQSSEERLSDARRLLETRVDWGVDLSDCLSFAIMRNLGIRRAFTFDLDFEKAGFETVP